MNKYLKVMFCILIFFNSACTKENNFWMSLVTKVDSGQKEIFLNELTDYEWDFVCVLEPYALDVGGEGNRIKTYLPYNLGNYENKIPNLNSDGLWAFAFIKDDTVIKIERKGRSFYLEKRYENNCLHNNQARFLKMEQYRDSNKFLLITDF